METNRENAQVAYGGVTQGQWNAPGAEGGGAMARGSVPGGMPVTTAGHPQKQGLALGISAGVMGVAMIGLFPVVFFMALFAGEYIFLVYGGCTLAAGLGLGLGIAGLVRAAKARRGTQGAPAGGNTIAFILSMISVFVCAISMLVYGAILGFYLFAMYGIGERLVYMM